MEEHKRHETPEKSKRIIKFILIGISALTLISSLSIPWSTFTPKETIISLLGLLFINGFLLWSYHILFVWRQGVFEQLELKHEVKIVGNSSGSFKIDGDVNPITKLILTIYIFSYFIIGMLGPFALFVGALIWLR